MSNSVYYASAIALFAALVASVLSLTSAYGQQQQPLGQDNTARNPPFPFGLLFTRGGNFSFGEIASIQNNESGQPAWIAVGHWRGNLFSFNQTTTNNNNTNTSPNVVFNADFRMIMLNGSAAHTHVITNFKASNISSYANGTKLFSGTATVGLRNGPQTDVPTIIKTSGDVISIVPDQVRVDHHYGNTPIYGVVENAGDHRRGGGEPMTSLSNGTMTEH